MAFPTSPANNQTALVNGIVYQWNNTLGAWKRNGSVTSISVGQLLLTSAQTSITNGSGSLIVSGGAGISGNIYSGGIYITGSANGITFPDSTVQLTAYQGFGIDNVARTTANTPSHVANSASSYANAAFTQANSVINVTSSRYNTRKYTANGVQNTFTISSSHSANSVLVFENGICQEPITDYSVSGTTLTFTTAPANNVTIQIRELPV